MSLLAMANHRNECTLLGHHPHTTIAINAGSQHWQQQSRGAVAMVAVRCGNDGGYGHALPSCAGAGDCALATLGND
eukprot:1114464-Alexandrium_andersonii.AAC.1